MNNTLFDGDNILIYKYPLSIQSGNIIILEENTNSSVRKIHPTLIKRVIATEGDTVLFQKDQHLSFNRYTVSLSIKRKGETEFQLCEEPYIKEPMEYFESEFTDSLYGWVGIERVVPDGQLFVLGDNRNESSDSRQLGFFSKNEVIGKLCIRLKHGSLFEKIILLLY